MLKWLAFLAAGIQWPFCWYAWPAEPIDPPAWTQPAWCDCCLVGPLHECPVGCTLQGMNMATVDGTWQACDMRDFQGWQNRQ